MSNRSSGKHIRLLKSYSSILLLLLGLPTAAVYALPDDRNQPIHLTADKALRDEKKGVTIYSGNVQMKQGSMELEADTLTIYHESDDPSEIIAEGNPARMRQQPELDDGVVHAHAQVITYYKNEDRVHLQTKARLEQDGSVVDGDSIDYLIAKQLITAESDQSKEGNKVVVVIPPSAENADDSTAPDKPPAGDKVTPPATQQMKESGSGRTTSE
jgi:lipopolysaccharide export system protein LptA